MIVRVVLIALFILSILILEGAAKKSGTALLRNALKFTQSESIGSKLSTSLDASWFTGENTRTINGAVPEITCPRGF